MTHDIYRATLYTTSIFLSATNINIKHYYTRTENQQKAFIH